MLGPRFIRRDSMRNRYLRNIPKNINDTLSDSLGAYVGKIILRSARLGSCCSLVEAELHFRRERITTSRFLCKHTT